MIMNETSLSANWQGQKRWHMVLQSMIRVLWFSVEASLWTFYVIMMVCILISLAIEAWMLQIHMAAYR